MSDEKRSPCAESGTADVGGDLRGMGRLATVTELRTPCPECLLSFTAEEWDTRHSSSDGEDVHEECCDVCHGDDMDHRR